MPFRFNPFTGNLDLVDTTAAAGSDTQIQFNDTGSLAGDVDLTWNKTTNVMTVAGDVNLSDGGSFTTTLQTITPTANRTVSIPDATGTLALVAGSSGQLVYNNAGVYAGIPGSTVGASGNVTLNAASGFAGNLLDLQVNGSSLCSVNNMGRVTTPMVGSSVSSNFSGVLFSPATHSHYTSNAIQFHVDNGWISIGQGNNTRLASDAANTLAQRNGTNAQTFRVYNTYTSSSDYELGKLEWNSNVFRIGTEKGSGGGTKRGIEIHTDGTNRIRIDAGDNFTALNLNAYNFYIGTDLQFKFLNGAFSLDSPSQIEWSSTSTAGQGPDIALKRDAAGVVKVTDGSTGNGTLLAQHRLAGTAPATSTSTGTAGDIRYDADYIYVCTATNTWKRAALTTW